MVVKRKSPTKSHKKIKHISNFEQNEERLLDQLDLVRVNLPIVFNPASRIESFM